MITNNSYTDYSDIDLQVNFRSGKCHENVKCSLLRIYSGQYDNCNAHALISGYEINGISVNGKIVDPGKYLTFQEKDGRSWQITSYKDNNPPEAPGLIFCLNVLNLPSNVQIHENL
jgi:hypothetical protein